MRTIGLLADSDSALSGIGQKVSENWAGFRRILVSQTIPKVSCMVLKLVAVLYIV
jgi:hypothetical protein